MSDASIPATLPWPTTAYARLAAFLRGIPEWTEDALCAQVDADLWFPDRGCSTRPAQRICAECPVQAECLLYALDHGERYGVWGGQSERERRRLARKHHLEGAA